MNRTTTLLASGGVALAIAGGTLLVASNMDALGDDRQPVGDLQTAPMTVTVDLPPGVEPEEAGVLPDEAIHESTKRAGSIPSISASAFWPRRLATA